MTTDKMQLVEVGKNEFVEWLNNRIKDFTEDYPAIEKMDYRFDTFGVTVSLDLLHCCTMERFQLMQH